MKFYREGFLSNKIMLVNVKNVITDVQPRFNPTEERTAEAGVFVFGL